MSWGSTAFTPIVTRNEPPFGFHETINPPDFKVCNENPWATGERMKREIQDSLKFEEYRKKLGAQSKRDHDMGYDLDYDHARQLRCVGGCGLSETMPFGALDNVLENFMSGSIFGYTFSETFTFAVVLLLFVWWIYKNSIKFSFKGFSN